MVWFISNRVTEECRFDRYAGRPTGTFPPQSVTICLLTNADLRLLDVGGISGRLTGTVCVAPPTSSPG